MAHDIKPAETDAHGNTESDWIVSTLARPGEIRAVSVHSQLDYFDPANPDDVQTDVETRWAKLWIRKSTKDGYDAATIELTLDEVKELRDALDAILAIEN